ncbi:MULTISPECIES: GGDEF domain-containing protein [Paenibacillus]|uniref:GGDEF domain-containing protein n=1 Tax=Paenibacillus TaxID=44249 RepID=UPI0022B8A864|nr:GGDEF domain-containing protein [Paenibacillus caseinilyticus]MCZ8523430.1 GGDEF domain-containing protein [Paenibacillus caseinilyticus]
MKYLGRLTTTAIIAFVHTSYLIYYYFRDGIVDTADLLGYPLLLFLAWWAGLQYDRAKYYSEKDSLTNLYNRRFVTASFDKMGALANRNGAKLYVLVMDCDNFKEINDRYSHHTGDKVLRAISGLLLRHTRQSDVVARWGGDEFVVLGQYKDNEGLQAMLLRLQDECARLSEQYGMHIAISIGSSLYPDDSRDLYGLIKTADRHMYQAKAAKRE